MSTSNQPSIQAPPARFRLRVRYAKRGRLAYLGHLELIHTIERCIRRAALPYAVSQGFSPHMRVGYTSALPVGTASACEYYDVFLTELVPIKDAFDRLLTATPADLAPLTAAYVDLRAPALTADITRVRYAVKLEFRPGCVPGADVLDCMLARLRRLEEIPYTRGKKHKVLDLRRTLVTVNIVGCEGDGVALALDTRCDNEGSLRPELLLAALDQLLCGIEPGSEEIVSTGIQELTCIVRYRVQRTEQLIEDPEGTLRSPLPDVSTEPPGPSPATALTNI